jgi:anti-sigma B factor antagonist
MDVTGDQRPDPPLTVAREAVDGQHRVTVRGELDAFTMADVRAVIAEAVDGDVALDLTGITFIDSSGLAMIVEARQRLESQDRRLIVGPRSRIVQRLLELSGMAARLDAEPTS